LEGDVPASSSDPEQVVGASETWAEVMRAMAQLGVEHRSVLVLRHLQGMTYREIANAIGISDKKVKSRLFEARRQIRDVLVERGVMR
jgi:RNA polymerase sigma-70 factor (ECF subfamily)